MSSYDNLKKRTRIHKRILFDLLFVCYMMITALYFKWRKESLKKIIKCIVIMFTNQCWKLALSSADLKLLIRGMP